MRWPFDVFSETKPVKNEYPVRDCLLRTIALLKMEIGPETGGFLTQALLVEELAKRIVEIEKRLAKQAVA